MGGVGTQGTLGKLREPLGVVQSSGTSGNVPPLKPPSLRE